MAALTCLGCDWVGGGWLGGQEATTHHTPIDLQGPLLDEGSGVGKTKAQFPTPTSTRRKMHMSRCARISCIQLHGSDLTVMSFFILEAAVRPGSSVYYVALRVCTQNAISGRVV